jgi:hypothetical protein
MTEATNPGVTIARPGPGESAVVKVVPGETYSLEFDPAESQVLADGDDLILMFEDGARLVFEDVLALVQLENGPKLQHAGSDVIALLRAEGTIPGVADGITLLEPPSGETYAIDVEAGQRYIVRFDPATALVRVDDGNMILSFENGGEIIIRGLGQEAVAGTLLLGQATALDRAETETPTSAPTLETAAAEEGVPGSGASQSGRCRRNHRASRPSGCHPADVARIRPGRTRDDRPTSRTGHTPTAGPAFGGTGRRSGTRHHARGQ